MATGDIVPSRLLAEAARLMRRMTFSTASGGSARGERVQVIADPRWDEDVRAYRLLLQCYAPGHDSRVWAGMPVALRAEGGGAPSYVVRLDARGRAVVPALPPGEYELRTATTWLVSETPVAYPVATFGAGLSGTPAAPPSSGGPTVLPTPSPLAGPQRFAGPREAVFATNNEQLRCTVRQASGWLYLSFETVAETLDSARIYFALVDAAGRIQRDGEMILSQAGEERRWHAQWEGTVASTEPLTLVCLAWSPEE